MPEVVDCRLAQRHTLVWIDPPAWQALCAAQGGDPLPEDWALARRPVVIRRRVGADGDRLPLGLPLPPAQGKQRLFLRLPPSCVVAVERMPTLERARACAPAHWQPTIERILAIAPQPRVFGSLAWQCLTGLAYLSPASDLDLLIDLPATGHQAMDLLRQLQQLDGQAALRIDGECVRADGAAVKWRELASDSRQLLVRRLDGVQLVARGDFLLDSFGA